MTIEGWGGGVCRRVRKMTRAGEWGEGCVDVRVGENKCIASIFWGVGWIERKENGGWRGWELPFIPTSYPVWSHCRLWHIVPLGLAGLCGCYDVLLLLLHNTYIHSVYIHTDIHSSTYIHTYIHTYINAECIYTYTHTHTYIHTYIHSTYIIHT